jgi:predicted ribosomally synthesized peptide with SipW-like signal peptide
MSKQAESGTIDLPRRRVLGALGAVGVGSAAGGLGTGAFFSDEEQFEGNVLTAGELDLKVDWEEHYSDWSPDEANLEDADGGNDLDVRMSDPGADGFTPLPDPGNPLVWVADDDLDEFMDNTAIEAYPDTSGNGIQDAFGEGGVDDICADGADTPEDLDPRGGTGLRTDNADTYDDANDEFKPLVSLDDVKPGDFGELTLSFHLCDNPGYVWLQGELVSAAENGTTEPEANDDDEQDGVVELLDAIQTTLWYDENGNNVIDGGVTGTTDLDVVLVLDNSNSIDSSEKTAIADAARTFIDLLSAGSQSASVAFAADADLLQGLTTDKTVAKSAITTYENTNTVFETRIGEGIESAKSELDANGTPGADDIIIVLSDGAPFPRGGGQAGENTLQKADEAKAAGDRIVSLGFGLETFGDAEAYLRSIAGTTPNSESDFNDGSPYDDEGDFFAAPTAADLEQAFEEIAGRITEGEEVFFRGSLREALSALSGGNGIPLDGDRSTEFDEISDPDDADTRECFEASTTDYLGFAWYLPVDHANEIQTDSVEFDLGFYAEQCRHNDGAGQVREGREFLVRIENVSTPDTLSTSQGSVAVPLSPGAFAVHDAGTNPLFVNGQPASDGLEDVAEDGVPTVLGQELAAASGVTDSGTFALGETAEDPNQPPAPAPQPPIFPGGAYEFTVTASPGQRLSFATMFIQSNDLLYAPGQDGVALFESDGTPVSGDITGAVNLYDAGTEVNEEPGVGPNQAPRQSGFDTGSDENGVVRPIGQVDDGFSYPDDEDVIEVTVTPQ